MPDVSATPALSAPGPASGGRLRRLARAVALFAAGSAALHHVNPALPFPLVEAWFAAGAVGAAVLGVVPLGGAWRRIGVLVVTALLLRGGLPAAHNATFPWIELGRARLPEWEDLAILGACAALTATRAGEGALERWVTRIVATVGLIALAITLLLPVKASFQVLTPAQPGMTAAPVLGWAAPAQVRWKRVDTEGDALRFLPALVRDEWALMDLAGGIHQEAGRAALARGEGTVAVTRIHEGVRYGLVRALEGVVALALLARAAAVPAAALLVASLLSGRALPASRLSRAALRASVWLVPIANLVALGVATLVWLPDDLALRIPALVSTLGMLALLAAVEASAAPGAVAAATTAREAA